MVSFLDLISAETGLPIVLIVIALLWSLVWKAIALWRSARHSHIVWFILFFFIHTLGILEILYVFLFSKIKLPNIKKNNKKAGKKK